MNFYKRFIGDYLRDTADLSLSSHGAYLLLLDYYYATEHALPDDLAVLCRICRASKRSEKASVSCIVNRYFPVAEDGLRHNARADAEIAAYMAMVEHNQSVGKLGGRPRGKNTKPGTNHSGLLGKPQWVPETKPSHSQKPDNFSLSLGITDTSSSVGSEPQKNGSEHPAVKIVETIPLNDGSGFDVTEAFCNELSRLYPAVDTEQTLREIRGWCLANANRRKTVRGVRAFINNWMQREQNRG